MHDIPFTHGIGIPLSELCEKLRCMHAVLVKKYEDNASLDDNDFSAYVDQIIMVGHVYIDCLARTESWSDECCAAAETDFDSYVHKLKNSHSVALDSENQPITNIIGYIKAILRHAKNNQLRKNKDQRINYVSTDTLIQIQDHIAQKNLQREGPNNPAVDWLHEEDIWRILERNTLKIKDEQDRVAFRLYFLSGKQRFPDMTGINVIEISDKPTIEHVAGLLHCNRNVAHESIQKGARQFVSHLFKDLKLNERLSKDCRIALNQWYRTGDLSLFKSNPVFFREVNMLVRDALR